MPAYDILLKLIQEYLFDLGYDNQYIKDFISPKIFKELISIRLANANIMIKNKTDNKSHQTHIAITGEAINFFYSSQQFIENDNTVVDKKRVIVSEANLAELQGKKYTISDTTDMKLTSGYVTVGKRTQKQVQLSKRNTDNSPCFNELRNGLYENDLLILLKYRESDQFLAIGIPQVFYLDFIPDYAQKYETNTYLRLIYLNNG